MSSRGRESIVLGDSDEHVRLDSSRRWRAAIHEAGHAVIAVALGYELQDVEIESAFRCRVRLALPLVAGPAMGISAPTEDEVERDAGYTLAGGEAEKFFFPYGPDEELLWSSDQEHFDRLSPTRIDEEGRAEWHARMGLEASRHVSERSAQIHAVAQALFARGRLSPSAVEKIIGGV